LINHILLFISSVLIFEFITYVKLYDISKKNILIYKKIIKLFDSRKVSDFRKEKLLLKYSISLFIVSIKIAIILVLIFVFMLIINFFYNSYLDYIITFFGMIELSVFLIIYFFIRKKINITKRT